MNLYDLQEKRISLLLQTFKTALLIGVFFALYIFLTMFWELNHDL